MSARYDWNYWRKAYVTGDDSVTLESITNTPGAPKIDALKKYSRLESWVKQREEYRLRNTPAVYENTQAIAAVEQVNKLVDISEMIVRHGKFARVFQNLVAKWAGQYDPTGMKPSEAAALLKLGTDLERLCAGMETETVGLQVKIQESVEKGIETELRGFLEGLGAVLDRDTFKKVLDAYETIQNLQSRAGSAAEN